LRRLKGEPRAAVLAAWGETSRALDGIGVGRRRAETHLELARRAVSARVLSAEAELALGDLARLATAAWYGASSPGQAGALRAIDDALTVVRSARGRLTGQRRLAAALDPRVILA